MFSFAARTRATIARISPQVWRVLTHSLLFGLAGSIADLLFNFYLVSLGYGADTAGLMATVYRGAGALLGLPLGILIDRFGARALLVVGAIGFGIAYALVLMVSQLWALILFVFLAGAANVLTLTAVVPLLTGITDEEERAAVFGMNASAGLIIGLVGSGVGGLLPGTAALFLGVATNDTAAYRMALSIVVVLGCLSALPVLIGFRARQSVFSPAPLVAPPPTTHAANAPGALCTSLAPARHRRRVVPAISESLLSHCLRTERRSRWCDAGDGRAGYGAWRADGCAGSRSAGVAPGCQRPALWGGIRRGADVRASLAGGSCGIHVARRFCCSQLSVE